MPKVHFLNELVTVEVPAGAKLLEVAEKQGIPVIRGIWPEIHCGNGLLGRLAAIPNGCNRCKLWVSPVHPGAVNEKTRREKTRFRLNGALPRIGSLRLACQVKVLGDVEVHTRATGENRARDPVWEADPRPSRWRERWAKAKAGGAETDEDAKEAEA